MGLAGFAPSCRRCHELCPAGASVCECGARLTLSVRNETWLANAPGPHCTCGGEGICTFCAIAELEGDRP